MKCIRLKSLFFVLAALLPNLSHAQPGDKHQAKDQALIAAVKQGDANAVDRLLNEGANANARDLPTAMRWVNKHKMSRPLTALLLAVGDIPPVEPGRMPGAYEHNRPDVGIMRLLLEHGADPNAVDEDNNSPLWLALNESDTEVALLLIRHSAKMVVMYGGKPYPLLIAAANSFTKPSVLQAMLDKGTDINVQDSDGETALMMATRTRKVDVVRFLLAHHANVAIKDRRGDRVLSYAKREAYEDSLQEKQTLHLLRQMLRQAGAR